MEFEWDENKRQEVLKKRNLDILDAALIFENPVLEKIDSRKDYGEVRYCALGMVGDQVFNVIYTMRGETIRLITAWEGGKDDKREYQESVATRNS